MKENNIQKILIAILIILNLIMCFKGLEQAVEYDALMKEKEQQSCVGHQVALSPMFKGNFFAISKIDVIQISNSSANPRAVKPPILVSNNFCRYSS